MVFETGYSWNPCYGNANVVTLELIVPDFVALKLA